MTILTSNGDGTFTEFFSGQTIIHTYALNKKQADKESMTDILNTPLAISTGIVCGELNNKEISQQLYETKGHEDEVKNSVNKKAKESLEDLKLFIAEEKEVQNRPQEIQDYFNQIMGTDYNVEENIKRTR